MHLASILIVRDIAYTEEKIIAWQKFKKQMNLQSTQIWKYFILKLLKQNILKVHFDSYLQSSWAPQL